MVVQLFVLPLPGKGVGEGRAARVDCIRVHVGIVDARTLADGPVAAVAGDGALVVLDLASGLQSDPRRLIEGLDLFASGTEF